MANRGFFILTQIAAHPRDSLAAHDVVRVDHVFDAGNGGDVPTNDNGGIRREAADHAAHLAHFGQIHDDRGNTYDVVLMLLELASKVLPRGEIQHGAWGRDIGLN